MTDLVPALGKAIATAHNEVKYLEDTFAAGAIDYITKPVNKLEMLARVRVSWTVLVCIVHHCNSR